MAALVEANGDAAWHSIITSLMPQALLNLDKLSD